MIPLREFPANNLPDAFQSALAVIAGRLRHVTEPWVLGGGLMLAARGLPIPARDIDLFAEPETAHRMTLALWVPGLAPGSSAAAPVAAPTDYASEFFTHFSFAGADGDLIGGFARRHEAGVYRVAIGPDSQDAWLVGEGWRVPLLRAEEWLVVYWLQPKGDGREARLEEYLSRPGNLDRGYLQRLLAGRSLPERVRNEGRRFLAAPEPRS